MTMVLLLDAGGLDPVWSCDQFTDPHRPGAPTVFC